MSCRHSKQTDRREAGFTLIELLITLTITVAIMTVVLTAVDMNANITRVQSDVSDVQQSTRVAQRDMQRLVRMAGRGGLPRQWALSVEQDADDLELSEDEPERAKVVDATDVLTVRGAFTSPVFRIDAADPTTFVNGGPTATLLIDSVTKSAFDQPLSSLHDLAPGEAILLVGSQGDSVFAVVKLMQIDFDPTVTLDIQNQSRTVERATLTVALADEDAADYLNITSTPGTFPANLTSVAFASVLEEYKFFIREDFSIPNDPTSRPSPKLARARMLPPTMNTLHPDDGVIDIADNIFDLQVAFGIDLDNDGRINIEDGGGAPLPANADEWRWNDLGDEPDDLAWDPFSLQHVRLTIVAQAQTADRTYISPAMPDIENRDYDEVANPGSGEDTAARRYRRRLLQSTVDLRNL